MAPALAPPALEPPAGLSAVPPPWTLEAESWIFPHWTSSAHIRSTSASSSSTPGASAAIAQRQGLDPGSYAPREVLYSGAEADVFKGGLGGWIIYRYHSSPAGPYDELIHVAGSFESAETGMSTLRITNIYVSTDASVWNGRRNWNIPKHRADFSFVPTSGGQTVRVSLPGAGEAKPFFAAHLTPRTWLPAFPGAYETQQEKDTVVHSDPPRAWRVSQPTFSGSMRFASAEPLLDGAFGDGVNFAKLERTWCSLGVYFPHVTVTFPLALEVGPGARSSSAEGPKGK